MNAGVAGQPFTILPSRILTCFLVLSAIVCLCAICCLPWAAGWKAAGVAGLLVVAGFSLMRDAWLRLPQSCVAFELTAPRRLSLVPLAGDPVAGVISDSSFVSPYLTLINIRTDTGRRRSLVIMPDSLQAEDYRRLRVRLRWSTQA
ncbi:protein YgfX [Ferrigenium sp. UT5]|uniref:protein YgfX n=1 Tax=Ferrigenium sp. UT5 TaxID=3242105 RepID=UPI0038B35CBE